MKKISRQAEAKLNKLAQTKEENYYYVLNEPLENQRKEWEASAVKEFELPENLQLQTVKMKACSASFSNFC